ncbi:mRNAs degradation promoting protein [Komagataella phaffii CBS 7435]|uniref:Pumilio homology domain family member 3 n=2 Tax=Komagataella phaffii TaxID=460519 RepID=C4R0Z4_KOMPG|nr:Protein of the mitochondrial outer surface [Komagataella phaffii GS115]AOA62694.1 GQ67_00587T0 [Komagataella phaffii]CAH2448307.1 mRNAs degradation promoting protein [Komagataella phaffii CBS 7435]AOA66962.1 GQ68_00801T0 [Komagataella phaffii GS115]CAY69168.1 Protein of the mitochondrial outer surface [Komagataella phaffii GS115]CCA38441.1 mRNAs degradation promoting protein [Komagataella phaffii CBS 7435]
MSVDENISLNPWDNKSAGAFSKKSVPSISPFDMAPSLNGNTLGSNFFNSTSSIGANNIPKGSAVVSDTESDVFAESPLVGLNKGALSAISAPLGTYNNNNKSNGFPNQLFGAASVSGGQFSSYANGTGASAAGSNFLEKFGSLTEKTREVEFNMKSLAIGTNTAKKSGSRRTSFLVNEPSNPSGSRHQSFSEKIDSYLSSPHAHRLSISSDHTPSITEQEKTHNTIWNPAGATSFHPSNTFQPRQYPPVFNPVPFPYSPYMFQPMSPFPPMNEVESEKTKDGIQPSATVLKHPKPTSGEGSSVLTDEPEQNFNNDDRNCAPISPFVMPPFSPYGMMPSVSFDATSPPIPMLPEGMSGQVPSPFPQHSAPPKFPAAANNSGSKPPAKNGRASKNRPRAQHIYRSPLLEEFRSNKAGKDYRLRDIYGHGPEFARDQHGSRFIQQQLSKATKEEKDTIFEEIEPTSYELMTDVFGNYVIQKYFEHGSEEQKARLLKIMTGKVQSLSLQMYGCRVVQRALEFVQLEQQIEIASELQDNVLQLVEDQNGNHVIQKSIEKISFDQISFILESLRQHIYHLSTHPYGCRVIQRLLEYCSESEQKFILEVLSNHIFYLIQDQYGNYVIQHILEFGEEGYRSTITEIVTKNLVMFSKHKFASNAVEKCIIYGNKEHRHMLFNELLKDNKSLEVTTVDDNSALALMMKDPFANYVVQKMVDALDEDDKKLLIIKIKQYLKQISKSSYAKHLASIEKLILLSETALKGIA